MSSYSHVPTNLIPDDVHPGGLVPGDDVHDDGAAGPALVHDGRDTEGGGEDARGAGHGGELLHVLLAVEDLRLGKATHFLKEFCVRLVSLAT